MVLSRDDGNRNHERNRIPKQTVRKRHSPVPCNVTNGKTRFNGGAGKVAILS